MYFLVGVTCLFFGFAGGLIYADYIHRKALDSLPKLPPYITKE